MTGLRLQERMRWKPLLQQVMNQSDTRGNTHNRHKLKDPVCGMNVELSSSAGHSHDSGQTYQIKLAAISCRRAVSFAVRDESSYSDCSMAHVNIVKRIRSDGRLVKRSLLREPFGEPGDKALREGHYYFEWYEKGTRRHHHGIWTAVVPAGIGRNRQ